MEKFPHALGFESLDLFLKVSEQGLCLTGVEENAISQLGGLHDAEMVEAKKMCVCRNGRGEGGCHDGG